MAGIQLPNNQTEGLAAAASYTSATTLLTVPTNTPAWAKVVFRHTGSSGFWYGSYGGNTPTTSSYSFKLAPGEPEQLDNPPEGTIKLLASGSGIGDLSYSVSYRS
jgi:hypothetical protein